MRPEHKLLAEILTQLLRSLIGLRHDKVFVQDPVALQAVLLPALNAVLANAEVCGDITTRLEDET